MEIEVHDNGVTVTTDGLVFDDYDSVEEAARALNKVSADASSEVERLRDELRREQEWRREVNEARLELTRLADEEGAS